MGNVSSREQLGRQADVIDGVREDEDGRLVERKLRYLAALSSRMMMGSTETLNELQQQQQQPRQSPKGRTIISASLKDKGLVELPQELFLLSELTTLDISSNKLRHLHERFANLKRLKRISLGSNHISIIPDCIGELTELVWVDFTHNDVHTISDAFANLQMLSSLGASDCRLTEIPRSFCKLSNLKKLGLFNNLLTSLPAEIGNLSQLTKLDLSGNALVRLPKEVGHLKELTWLNLSRNQLVELPEELGKLTKLTELGLAFNRLQRLPDLSNLTELTLLPVYSNELEEIGEWICSMINLTKLDLSFNKLESIPEGIFRLPNLDFINLRRNNLKCLPSFDSDDPCARSASITSIDVRENSLEWIPISLMGPRIQEFKCAGNPLKTEAGYLFRSNKQSRLKDIALNTLIQAGIQPNCLFTTKMTIDYHDAHYYQSRTCANCVKRYILQPCECVIFVETSDHPLAAFLLDACSHECLSRFNLLGGVHYPAPVVDDPRSPRLRDS